MDNKPSVTGVATSSLFLTLISFWEKIRDGYVVAGIFMFLAILVFSLYIYFSIVTITSGDKKKKRNKRVGPVLLSAGITLFLGNLFMFFGYYFAQGRFSIVDSLESGIVGSVAVLILGILDAFLYGGRVSMAFIDTYFIKRANEV